MNEPQVQSLIADLRRGIARRPRDVIKRARQAGVLVALLVDGPAPSLLLTRRTETLSSHRGEVAFPGGMRDEGDTGLIETALREAREEVGLPSTSVEVIGQLDDLLTMDGRVSVTPTIGVVRARPQWVRSEREVARIFEIPLSELSDPERWRVEQRGWRGRDIPVYFFDFEDEILWGLSAYVTLLTLGALNARLPIGSSPHNRSELDIRPRRVTEAT